jgi:hypothetical protein
MLQQLRPGHKNVGGDLAGTDKKLVLEAKLLQFPMDCILLSRNVAIFSSALRSSPTAILGKSEFEGQMFLQPNVCAAAAARWRGLGIASYKAK